MSTYIIGYGGIYDIGQTRRKPKRDPVMTTLRYANRWARYFNTPISWLVTLAHLESGHDPSRVNMAAAHKGGAWGLLQQMADEAQYKIDTIKRQYRAYKPVQDVIRKKWKGRPQDLLDPDLNVILAAWQLGQLRKEFGDDFGTVAAAYHQGAGAVRKRLEEGKPPVSPKLQPKGVQYVQKAVATQESYEPALLAAQHNGSAMLATYIPSLESSSEGELVPGGHVDIEGERGMESLRHL